MAADAEEIVFAVQHGHAALRHGRIIGVFVVRTVPNIESRIAFGFQNIQPAVVLRQGDRRNIGLVAMPVQADGQAAAVEQHRQNRRCIAVLRVFEIGEKMRPHLPAVAPAFDVRRGERRTQIFRHLPNQGLPILPRRLVVGFDLRNRLRLVFFQLGKLVKRDVEQFAVFRRQHDACSFCGGLKRPISDCRHRLAAALHISGSLRLGFPPAREWRYGLTISCIGSAAGRPFENNFQTASSYSSGSSAEPMRFKIMLVLARRRLLFGLSA